MKEASVFNSCTLMIITFTAGLMLTACAGKDGTTTVVNAAAATPVSASGATLKQTVTCTGSGSGYANAAQANGSTFYSNYSYDTVYVISSYSDTTFDVSCKLTSASSYNATTNSQATSVIFTTACELPISSDGLSSLASIPSSACNIQLPDEFLRIGCSKDSLFAMSVVGAPLSSYAIAATSSGVNIDPTKCVTVNY